jgi:CRISPR-associated protein Cas1
MPCSGTISSVKSGVVESSQDSTHSPTLYTLFHKAFSEWQQSTSYLNSTTPQIELHGLDPYQACLHSGSDRHPALASDLIEEFRTPIIESIITRLVNNRAIDPDLHFEYRDGGCFLNSDGRRRFISSFIRHMDEPQGDHDPQPRWDRIVAQVKALRDRIADNARAYVPYRIR